MARESTSAAIIAVTPINHVVPDPVALRLRQSHLASRPVSLRCLRRAGGVERGLWKAMPLDGAIHDVC